MIIRTVFRSVSNTMRLGHAVRSNYLYAGVTDVYAETGEDQLMEKPDQHLERHCDPQDVCYRSVRCAV